MRPYWLVLIFLHIAAFFYDVALASQDESDSSCWLPLTDLYVVSAVFHFLFFLTITCFDTQYPTLLLVDEEEDLRSVLIPITGFKCAFYTILFLFLSRVYFFGLQSVCMWNNTSFLTVELFCFAVDVTIGLCVAFELE